MYVPLYTYVRAAADICFVLYDILSSFRIYFHFFIRIFAKKECNLKFHENIILL